MSSNFFNPKDIKMSSFTWISFIFVLCYIHFSLACCDSCETSCCSSCCSECQQQCTTSTCMDTCQSQCCGQSSRCCSQSSSCCSNCQQTCRTSSCYNQCQNQCCGRSKNCCEKSDCRTTAGPTRIGESSRSSSHSGSVKADVKSNNIINNNNKINMSIAVNSNLENTIKNEVGGGGGIGGNTTVIKIPVVIPSNQTTMIPPVPQRPGCCIVIVPCVTQRCAPYRWQCGGCKGNFGYQPINPCGGGCQKQDVWSREVCEEEECRSETVDCSECDDNFYETYSGYSQCHGCFQGH